MPAAPSDRERRERPQAYYKNETKSYTTPRSTQRLCSRRTCAGCVMAASAANRMDTGALRARREARRRSVRRRRRGGGLLGALVAVAAVLAVARHSDGGSQAPRAARPA